MGNLLDAYEERIEQYENARFVSNGVCQVCGTGITYVHYECEKPNMGYICASPVRKCWEKFWLDKPWPHRLNRETGNWEIWVDTYHYDSIGNLLGKSSGWEDTGWYLKEGF